MKKTTYLFVLLLSMAGYSQNFEWVKTPPINFSMNHDMIAYCTAVDPQGNVYFTGFKDNAVPYEAIMGDQYYNKYSDEGDLIFSKQITGDININYLTTDSQGNVLMAVGYLSNLSIDNLQLTSVTQGVKHHLLKFSSSGNLLWQQELTITDWFVNGFMSIELDAGDNIYIGYDDYQNSYIRKMSPEGATILTIEQMNAARISSLSIDSEGNIYAAGSCVGPLSTFGGTSATTDFPYDIYAVKYSPAGTFQWIKFVEDITCPAPHIAAYTPDAVYFSSQLYEESGFDDIDTEGPSAFSEDIFIAKLNASGEYQWVREVPGEGFMSIGNRSFLTLDQTGNIYFGGRGGGNINWGNGIQTSTPSTNGELLILKYNPEGQILFAKTAGGENSNRTDCIAVNHTGDVFISGMVMGNAAFDSHQTTAESFVAYPFLAKLAQDALGTGAEPESAQAVLYPNPASEYIILSNVSNVSAGTIYNTLGQIIKNVQITGSPISISELSKGIYVIKIDGYKPLRFIKE